jgi:hypothetical protein
MHHAIVLFALFASASLTVACEKSGTDLQSKANEAQEQANRQIGQANAQATEAQRVADQRIAAAEADFIKLREDYRINAWSHLDAMDKRISGLDAKAVASAVAKPGLRAVLPTIHAQRDVFANDIRSIDATSAATFDATKARLDEEWAALKALVDGAN